jgi:hypothetical protein
MKNLSFVKSVFAQETGEFDELIGGINVPEGVTLISAESGGDIGILVLVSKLIQIVTVVASVWVVINVVLAAYQYLSGGGKADNHTKVNNILTMSITGLIIIVSTYTIAGLIGLIFFKDPMYIINPTITSISGS